MVGGCGLSRLSVQNLRMMMRNERLMSTYIRAASVNTDLKVASKEPRLKVEKVPKEAKVVICGGGAQGAAIAYKLAEAGWGDKVRQIIIIIICIFISIIITPLSSALS